MKKISKIEVKSKLQSDLMLAIVYKKNKVNKRVNLSVENQILQTSIVPIEKDRPINAHKHHLIRRETFGTLETWVILNGRGLVSFYDIDDAFLLSYKVSKGDVIVNFTAGHSLKSSTKHLTIVEVKNGPYWGVELDKISISD